MSRCMDWRARWIMLVPVDGYTKLAGKTDGVGLKCCGVCSPSYSAFDWDNTCIDRLHPVRLANLLRNGNGPNFKSQ